MRAEQPCGQFDLEIALIDRYHWTQEQINDTDSDLLEELMEFLAAKEKFREEEEKRLKAEAERSRKGKSRKH